MPVNKQASGCQSVSLPLSHESTSITVSANCVFALSTPQHAIKEKVRCFVTCILQHFGTKLCTLVSINMLRCASCHMQMIHGVASAAVRDMDLWSISMHSGLPDKHHHNSLQSPHPPQDNAHDQGFKRQHGVPLQEQAPFIDDELPSAVHAQDAGNIQGSKRAGKFTYYFTVGLDAEAAYRYLSHGSRLPQPLMTWRPAMYSQQLPLTSTCSGVWYMTMQAGYNALCLHSCVVAKCLAACASISQEGISH